MFFGIVVLDNVFVLGMNLTSANISLVASQRDSFSKAVTKNLIVVALGISITYINAILVHTFHKHQVSCSSHQKMILSKLLFSLEETLLFKVTYNQS